MSLHIASLNSGSNGNCYYIGNAQEAVLIDAGISCRETVKRLRRLSLSVDKVKAIFISHEHTDHIYGVKVLAERYNIQVYITAATLQNSRLVIKKDLVHSFSPFEQVNIGNLAIYPFTKSHDAIDPHSFVVTSKGVTVGVFTDIGTPCEHLVHNFSKCHAAFLEANYDDNMLQNGKYPIHLKKRIAGDKGHLSNAQAVELFLSHRPAHMTHLFLSHLSKENNDPSLVSELFSAQVGEVKIIVASRYEETPVYHITKDMQQDVIKYATGKAQQMSLFT